eukprot:9957369-Alexandrium_andersonii.AAC.1
MGRDVHGACSPARPPSTDAPEGSGPQVQHLVDPPLEALLLLRSDFFEGPLEDSNAPRNAACAASTAL